MQRGMRAAGRSAAPGTAGRTMAPIRSVQASHRCTGSAAFIQPAALQAHRPSRRRVCKAFAIGGLFGGLFSKSDGKPQPPPSFEFPPYSVVKNANGYDLRLYNVYPAVEMAYERRDEGYLALGGYVSGENDAGTKFRITQPVVMQYNADGSKVMRMYVGNPLGTAGRGPEGGPGAAGPSGAASLQGLPQPTNPDVTLVPAGGEMVAILRFEGNITQQVAYAMRKQLVDCLTRDGLALAPEDAAGGFRVAQYGPIHTLSTRVNEVMLRVKLE